MLIVSPTRRLGAAFRQIWTRLTGRGVPASRPHPRVIVHDPAAQRPHDLDDLFFDRTVQSRIGDVIANARRKK